MDDNINSYLNYKSICEKLSKVKLYDLPKKTLIVVLGHRESGKTTLCEALCGTLYVKNESEELFEVDKKTNPKSLYNNDENGKEEEENDENYIYPKLYLDEKQPFNILDACDVHNESMNEEDILLSSLLMDYYCKKAEKIVAVYVAEFSELNALTQFMDMSEFVRNILRCYNIPVYFVFNRCDEEDVLEEAFLSKSNKEKEDCVMKHIINKIHEMNKGQNELVTEFIRKTISLTAISFRSEIEESGEKMTENEKNKKEEIIDAARRIEKMSDSEMVQKASLYIDSLSEHLDGVDFNNMKEAEEKISFSFLLQESEKNG